MIHGSRHFEGSISLAGTIVSRVIGLFLLDFTRLDHTENLNNQLVRHQSVDNVRVNLEPVVFRVAELRLLLVLNHLCLLGLLVEPDISALVLVGELLVVDGGFLDLHVDLNPLAEQFLHVFVINQIKLRLFVRVKQLYVHLQLQFAYLKSFTVVNVLLVRYIQQVVNRL